MVQIIRTVQFGATILIWGGNIARFSFLDVVEQNMQYGVGLVYLQVQLVNQL